MSDLLRDVPSRLLEPHHLDRTTYLLDKSLKPEGYDQGLVAVASINTFMWLVRTALVGSGSADSWRKYNVGASILAYNFEVPKMGIFVGANHKPQEGHGLNLHAEQTAAAKARAQMFNRFMAIAVWGDPSDTNANPSGALTLRPCRRCSDMFATMPEIEPRTLLLSANQDLSVCELYTVGELATYYEDPNASGPISEIPPYSLADDMDEDHYDYLLATTLLPKINSLYNLAA